MAQHVVAAGGVRVDQITVFIPTGLEGAGNLILIGPTAGEHLLDLGEQLVGKGVGALICPLAHESGDELDVAVGQVIEHALEV